MGEDSDQTANLDPRLICTFLLNWTIEVGLYKIQKCIQFGGVTIKVSYRKGRIKLWFHEILSILTLHWYCRYDILWLLIKIGVVVMILYGMIFIVWYHGVSMTLLLRKEQDEGMTMTGLTCPVSTVKWHDMGCYLWCGVLTCPVTSLLRKKCA